MLLVLSLYSMNEISLEMAMSVKVEEVGGWR